MRLPRRLRRKHLRHSREVLAEPVAQAPLGAVDHGVDLPQRIVEIESDGANPVQISYRSQEKVALSFYNAPGSKYR